MRYRHKCIVAPLGIDLSRFTDFAASSSDMQRKETSGDLPILLFIGRFRHYKGLDVLVESMRQINAQLWLVGSGPLEGEVRSMVKKNGLKEKVKFLGNLPEPDLVACLKTCDMLILPSNFRSEAFGIVQLEAMACGKPVICTELKTGTSYVNRHGETGLVVKPNSPGEIAQAANYLIDNPTVRKQYGQNGAVHVTRNFSSDLMIDRIVDIYNNIFEGR